MSVFEHSSEYLYEEKMRKEEKKDKRCILLKMLLAWMSECRQESMCCTSTDRLMSGLSQTPDRHKEDKRSAPTLSETHASVLLDDQDSFYSHFY